MNCDNCGAKTTTRKVELFHYKQCGLPNVYLGNIAVIACKSCGAQCPIIPSVLELYDTVGRAVALKNDPLTGAEIRFLRKQLGLSAKAWADYLHVDVAVLSRWENNKVTIGQQSDSLIRLLYFRILEERAGEMIQEPLSSHIAAAVPDKPEDRAVFINMNNPGIFSFRAFSELARV